MTNDIPLNLLQVKNQTKDQLILKANRVGGMILGTGAAIVFFLIGFLYLNFGVVTKLRCIQEGDLQLTLAAQGGVCRITESRIFSSKIKAVIPINQIQKATIDLKAGKILLLTRTEPIVFASLIERQKIVVPDQRVVDQINAFLSDSQASSTFIEHDGRFSYYSPALIFGAAGLACLIMVVTLNFQVICVFDQQAEKMRLMSRSLLRKQMVVRDLADITAIQVKEQLHLSRSGNVAARTYKLMLVFKSQESILLDECTEEYQQDCVETAHRIRSFLNLRH